MAVDAGYGEGEHAVELATRFGFQVTGIDYDIKLGDGLWHVYRMIGKLSSRIYLLSAPGGPLGR